MLRRIEAASIPCLTGAEAPHLVARAASHTKPAPSVSLMMKTLDSCELRSPSLLVLSMLGTKEGRSMKAMHAICHYKNGRPDNLFQIGKGQGVFRSGYWRISPQEAPALRGGWLYLHETSNKPAYFMARIEEVGEPDSEGKYNLLVKKDSSRVDVTWRGSTPTPSRYVSIVEANRPHETSSHTR